MREIVIAPPNVCAVRIGEFGDYCTVTPIRPYVGGCVHEHVVAQSLCARHLHWVQINAADVTCAYCREIDGHECPVRIQPA